MSSGGTVGGVSEDLLRQLTPRVLAAIVRRFGDFHAAEDAVQEALLAADVQWPRQGIPNNPVAWLFSVASRRMKDHIRSELARRHREKFVAQREPSEPTTATYPDVGAWGGGDDKDDSLILLFMCCHPALTRTSAVALTLRAVAGLTTAEIARAYMVPESTMAQRISRAKKQIRDSGVPFRIPSAEDSRERLASIMHVLYLIFNEGYASSSTGVSFQRVDLSQEAIRLTRLLLQTVLDETEVKGLLALMLLTEARRGARVGREGELIPLAEQDRSLWDQRAIREGVEMINSALRKGTVGPYQVQAAIAALHDEAGSAEETDWPQILALYQLLQCMSDNPMVALNHAVALSMVHGPEADLARVKLLITDPRLSEYHRLAAVTAHMHEMSRDWKQAADWYRIAAERTRNLQEREYLTRRAARAKRHDV